MLQLKASDRGGRLACQTKAIMLDTNRAIPPHPWRPTEAREDAGQTYREDPLMEITSIPPDQEAFERDVLWTMYNALKSVRDEGDSDWQTLTSFFAIAARPGQSAQDAEATVRRYEEEAQLHPGRAPP
jgi:hypothetical protein